LTQESTDLLPTSEFLQFRIAPLFVRDKAFPLQHAFSGSQNKHAHTPSAQVF
jgi:hypothetical protein